MHTICIRNSSSIMAVGTIQLVILSTACVVSLELCGICLTCEPGPPKPGVPGTDQSVQMVAWMQTPKHSLPCVP